MTQASASSYAQDVLLDAVAGLTDAARWGAQIADYNAQHPSGPTLEAPHANVVELAQQDWDLLMPPQRYPAIRLSLLDTEDVPGINWKVGRTSFRIELRTFQRVSGRSGIVTAPRWSVTELTLSHQAFQRAAEYILVAHLTRAGALCYNAQTLPGLLTSSLPLGDATVSRMSRVVQCWATTRSARFDAPPQETP